MTPEQNRGDGQLSSRAIRWGTGLLLSAAIPIFAQEANAPRSIWDAVYTDAQADRGEGLYGRHCEQCHGSSLEGDTPSEVPALAGDQFLGRWNGRTLGDLVLRLERSMPQPAPGSLSRAQYVDVVAHVLRANRAPAGFDALGTAEDRLRGIVIQRAR